MQTTPKWLIIFNQIQQGPMGHQTASNDTDPAEIGSASAQWSETLIQCIQNNCGKSVEFSAMMSSEQMISVGRVIFCNG